MSEPTEQKLRDALWKVVREYGIRSAMRGSPPPTRGFSDVDVDEALDALIAHVRAETLTRRDAWKANTLPNESAKVFGKAVDVEYPETIVVGQYRGDPALCLDNEYGDWLEDLTDWVDGRLTVKLDRSKRYRLKVSAHEVTE